METKICKQCGKNKSFEEFVKKKTCRNGVEGTCKQCLNNRMQIIYRENLEIARNKGRIKQQRLRMRNPAADNLRSKLWKRANKSKSAAQYKAWLAKNDNLEQHKQASRSWRASNPLQTAKQSALRGYKKFSSEVPPDLLTAHASYLLVKRELHKQNKPQNQTA